MVQVPFSLKKSLINQTEVYVNFAQLRRYMAAIDV